MYIYTLNYNNIISYIIPTAHYNINLLFSDSEIKDLKQIINNCNIISFESKNKDKKDKKNKKDKIEIKDVYSESNMNLIVSNFNKIFKTNITNKDIESKNIMTLTPGPGIGGISGEINDIMDINMEQYAAKEFKDILYLDEGKDYNKFMKELEEMVKKLSDYLSENPLKIKDIKINMNNTKKEIILYKNLFKKTNKSKTRKNKNEYKDKKLALDTRNNIWAKKIANVINDNKSIAIFVGSNHIDNKFDNNLIDILKKDYNIIFTKIKY